MATQCNFFFGGGVGMPSIVQEPLVQYKLFVVPSMWCFHVGIWVNFSIVTLSPWSLLSCWIQESEAANGKTSQSNQQERIVDLSNKMLFYGSPRKKNSEHSKVQKLSDIAGKATSQAWDDWIFPNLQLITGLTCQALLVDLLPRGADGVLEDWGRVQAGFGQIVKAETNGPLWEVVYFRTLYKWCTNPQSTIYIEITPESTTCTNLIRMMYEPSYINDEASSSPMTYIPTISSVSVLDSMLHLCFSLLHHRFVLPVLDR